jgi:hypothetical protein
VSSATWKWETIKSGEEEAGDQLLGGGTGEGEVGGGLLPAPFEPESQPAEHDDIQPVPDPAAENEALLSSIAL